MGRKERCPHCGSKKIKITDDVKKCRVCKYEWTGKPRGKTSKKEKVRF
jgi:ribosomal protein L37AE/L43A